MRNIVQPNIQYYWVLRIVKETPSNCKTLTHRGQTYGYEWTWQKIGWPQKLIVKVEVDSGDIAELTTRQSKNYWHRLWVSAMDIEMNIKDLSHVQLGGRFVVDVPWPHEEKPLEPVKGLVNVIKYAYGI